MAIPKKKAARKKVARKKAAVRKSPARRAAPTAPPKPQLYGVKMVRGANYTYRGKKFKKWQCYAVTEEVRNHLVENRSGYFIDVHMGSESVHSRPIPVPKAPPRHGLSRESSIRHAGQVPVAVAPRDEPGYIEEVEFDEELPAQSVSRFSDDIPDDPEFDFADLTSSGPEDDGEEV